MGFIKNALGMIGDAATGGLASGVGSFVSGLFGGGGGIDYHDQKKLMEKQHGYELENMDYQAKLNEEMAQRNQERQCVKGIWPTTKYAGPFTETR